MKNLVGFLVGMVCAKGLRSLDRNRYTSDKEKAVVWPLAPFHALHDAFQTGFYKAYLYVWKDQPRDNNNNPKPDPSWFRFGIGATALTSISQGPATYAAVYGIGLLCSTQIGGLAGTITHGVLAGVVGAWFSSGRAFSGLASGLMIGVGVFAFQTYGMQALAALLPSLSEVQLHLVAGTATILGTFILESIAQVITRTAENKLFGQEYSDLVCYKSEYVLFYQAGITFDTWVDKCKNCGKSPEKQAAQRRDGLDYM